MKAAWQTKKLGDVCGFQNGFAFKSNKFSETGFPILRISNIQDEAIETRRVVYFELKDYKENLDKYRVLNGDLLIAMSGATTGKIGFNETDQLYYLNQRVGKFEPKDNLSKQFLFYFLSTRVEENLRISAGSAQPNLSTEQIKQFEIPVPPLPEQNRIVNILDEAFENIAAAKVNAEKNLKNARALFESHLQTVFTQRGEGWVEKKLGDVFEIGSSKRIMETEWTSSGVPFYGGKEIVKLAKFGSVVSNAYISDEKYREYASKYDMPSKDDILITARGTIGVGYIVQEGDRFYYKDGNVISMRGKTPTNPHFILYAFRSNVVADQFGDLSGTTVRHLPIEKAKELVLRMPGFAAQNCVVEAIREIEAETQRLESIYKQKIAALDELKKALLHKAFAGEL